MKTALTTSWTLIQEASGGASTAGEEFSRRYAPIIRAYLSARWRNTLLHSDIEDGIQEVFLQCFKEDGVLGKADPNMPGGFRAFLFGVVQKVALKFEARIYRRTRAGFPSGFELNAVPDSEESCSAIFDRAWARSLVKEAARLQAERARGEDKAAFRRVELLRLRFQEGLPIRKIARLWNCDCAVLHHEYARARREFNEVLNEILAGDNPNSKEGPGKALEDLLAVLN